MCETDSVVLAPINVTNKARTRCLILACGNTLRGDDGLGPWLASWAEERFHDRSDVRVISRQQWTPDLAADIAQSECVLFIDAAVNGEAGRLSVTPISAREDHRGLATHQADAATLLTLCEELYDARPRIALLLTIGVRSINLGEAFSEAVRTSLPAAYVAIEKFISDSK